MAVIDHIDGPNRDVYLHLDTVNTDLHPMEIYTAMRTLRRTDQTLRRYDLFMSGEGKVPKTPGKFTERYVILLDGTRIIPYDAAQILTITGVVITDDGLEGVDCFDRSSLVNQVDINYVPPQVEVIESGTSGLTTEESDNLAAIAANQVTIAGSITAIETDIGTLEASITAIDGNIVTITADQVTMRKLLENKVTRSGDFLTIYEDNGVDVWRTVDIGAGGRVTL